jgi:plastocyanin
MRLRFRKSDWFAAALAVAAFLVIATVMSHFIYKARSTPMPTVTVVQRDRHFYPDRLTIMPETVVHIVNDDRFIHHVYVKSPFMNFDSGDNPIGQAVDVEFDHAGTYDVQCAIHPFMHLWVTVK